MSTGVREIFAQITDYYGFQGHLKSAEPFGNGHINDTYLLVYEQGEKEVK